MYDSIIIEALKKDRKPKLTQKQKNKKDNSWNFEKTCTLTTKGIMICAYSLIIWNITIK